MHVLLFLESVYRIRPNWHTVCSGKKALALISAHLKSHQGYLLNQSFVSKPCHPPHTPQGNSGDFWNFVQKIIAISPHPAGTNSWQNTAICPHSLLCFTMRSCNPNYFRLKNKTPALWGRCKNKNPLSPTLPRGGWSGYNWLVHYHEWPYSQRRAVIKLLVKYASMNVSPQMGEGITPGD